MEKKVFVIIVFVIIYISSIDSKVFAQNCSGGPDDGQGCTNGGDLRNGCNWICNDAPPGTKLVPPPCCETLAQTGDPSTCCFDARRRCTPQQCASIPEGTLKQRCGQLWELGGYCNEPAPLPTQSPTQIPTPFIPTSIPPTITPQPTKIPSYLNQPKPTTKVINEDSFPTKAVQPKVNNVFSSPTPSPIPFKINLITINKNVRKPFGLFEYIFRIIVSYDQKLETWINAKISETIQKNLKK